MREEKLRERAEKFVAPFRIEDGRKFRLKDFDPGDTRGLESKGGRAKEILREGIALLADYQEKLYAQDRWAVLLIFQAMDAAGKDSAIKHVMSGVNPQGVQVYSFKAPSPEELDHDYLWRCTCRLPERGRIGIFNRSYYEEVLVVRVHPKILGGQKIPKRLVGKSIWKERFEDIAASSATSPATERSSGSFSFTFQRTSRRSVSSHVWTRRTRTGSSPLPTRSSATSGATTWRPTRT